jgi:hypothetical protein
MGRIRGGYRRWTGSVLAVAAVCLVLSVASVAPDFPVGGFKSQSCMAAVYEALGIWSFYPTAVALVWGMTCALSLNF